MTLKAAEGQSPTVFQMKQGDLCVFTSSDLDNLYRGTAQERSRFIESASKKLEQATKEAEHTRKQYQDAYLTPSDEALDEDLISEHKDYLGQASIGKESAVKEAIGELNTAKKEFQRDFGGFLSFFSRS